MTIVFFGGGRGCGGWEKEETDEMAEKNGAVWSQTSEKSTVWMKCRFHQKLWNQPPPPRPNLTHTPSSLRFWTREDVICHIWKVGEEERDCSPFRDAAILSLQRNISSRAHYYISPPQYWKQHVPSVSLCLSYRAIIKQIILLNDI